MRVPVRPVFRAPPLVRQSFSGKTPAQVASLNLRAGVPGKRRLWSQTQIYYPGVLNLDVAPDGQRFAVLSCQKRQKVSKARSESQCC
jgi:hypothetical protein